MVDRLCRDIGAFDGHPGLARDRGVCYTSRLDYSESILVRDVDAEAVGGGSFDHMSRLGLHSRAPVFYSPDDIGLGRAALKMGPLFSHTALDGDLYVDRGSYRVETDG